MKEKKSVKKWLLLITVLAVISLAVNLLYLNALYGFYNESFLKGELSALGSGADIIMIQKDEARCRVIGIDVNSGMEIISCFYGHRGDTTREQNGEEVTNIRILAFEEIYLGGTFTDGVYNYNGEYIGKFRKFFKYNDNPDVFWKVEVGLNGSTLEFCTMRDMEYSDTSRTKESCESLHIDIR